MVDTEEMEAPKFLWRKGTAKLVPLGMTGPGAACGGFVVIFFLERFLPSDILLVSAQGKLGL